MVVNDITKLTGMPSNAYGYGLMLTVGSLVPYLKLQIYIEESAINTGSKIYYRTRCDSGNWRRIMTQAL